ncbi:MAG: hypothetical protein ONB46_07945 [candidate division KSB1 bacterium]|nr:hypothetical protein [candidate division KSB1 bacterium]MDZ7365799.1 hypothetical protein [candidate division KSB1 bacterium]MDZ7403722.1 hypothetical protein [candidate division KSB1 bacterium]
MEYGNHYNSRADNSDFPHILGFGERPRFINLNFSRNDASFYNGLDTRWLSVYAGENVQFSGGEHAWDLVTADDQAIATGLYLYTVEDLESGEIQKGKFAVIK